MSKQISIVIPAFNEQDRLGKTIKCLQNHLRDKGINGEIVVVNDGCTDKSPEIAIKSKARCVGYGRNEGIAHAFRYGCKFTHGEYVVLIPADLNSPKILDDLFFALENGADVVQTSKRHPKSVVIGYSKARWGLSNLWNRIIRFVFHLPYKDTEFIRAFRRSVLDSILPKCRIDRAAGEAEMIIRAHRAGYKIVEIPCKIIHIEKGRINIRFIIKSVWDLIMLRFWLWKEDLEKLIGSVKIHERF